jgi:chloride channel 3/4/5
VRARDGHVHFADADQQKQTSPVAHLNVRKSLGVTNQDAGDENRESRMRRSSREFQKQEVARRSWLNDMRANIVNTFKARDATPGKKGLSHWAQFSTVSFQGDALEDGAWMHENSMRALSKSPSRFSVWKKWQDLVSWMIPAAIGFLTAASGSFIEKGVQWLSDLRFGYCKWAHFYVSQEICGSKWVPWISDTDNLSWIGGLMTYTLMSVLLATLSAILVWMFAPAARGSGIPEVKTILGGFVMEKVLDAKTLVVKIFGLCLSVSAGLSLGKEGPLVHVACCWANCLSRCFPRYTKNEAKQRELISTAAAAGVSVAFGAPLGGVLFSFEEVSTMFPGKTMVRAFFAAVVAALTLDMMNPTGSGKLTMFQTSYVEPPAILEYAWFLLLGILGGCIGSLFVHYNIRISSARAEGTRWRKRVHIIVEVAIIDFATCITSYELIYTRVLSSEVIRSLFHRCDGERDTMPNMMGLCAGDAPAVTWGLALTLLVSGMARFVQMTFTFGTGVPCGLFVPSLYTGACLGRVVGMLSHAMSIHLGLGITVYPGIYAMVGAAAVLGGVCRVTISLVVIMFELTGGLQLIMPFMLAVLVSKWVGDLFTGGIYDCCIMLRGYPFLHEPEDVTFTKRVCDIMDSDLECITAEPVPICEILYDLQNSSFGGFPLIRSTEDHTLLGYVKTSKIVQYLQTELASSAFVDNSTPVAFAKFLSSAEIVAGEILDLSEPHCQLIDESVIHVVPETPLAQVHNIFRQLGAKIVLVTRFGKLVGIITKKAFLHHLHEGHIGNIKHDPVVHASSALPAPASAAGLAEPLIV